MKRQRLLDQGEPSRSQLLSLLTEASELEHGLACSYLYSAFTLKQSLSEGGISWRHLQQIRLWAAQLFFVAAEEMLHLAQVWNLQAAVGGTPYYLRPNFPLPSNYYPLNLPVLLERFGLSAMERFIQYERPAKLPLVRGRPIRDAETRGFNTVGELYARIGSIIQAIPEDRLFIGYRGRQVGPELVDFPNLIKVTGRVSALAAVDLVTEQGEGTLTDRDDCHFGMFRGVRKQLLRAMAGSEDSGIVFEPARPSINNPIAKMNPALEAVGANEITDQHTASVADTFDSIYALMLRSLQYVFDNATSNDNLLRSLSRLSLSLMTTVVKPLGEALTLMPAGPGYEGQTAGPGFGLVRHVPLPNEPVATEMVVSEKLRELAARLTGLAHESRASAQLLSATRNLAHLAESFPALERRDPPPPQTRPSQRPQPDGRAMPLTTA